MIKLKCVDNYIKSLTLISYNQVNRGNEKSEECQCADHPWMKLGHAATSWSINLMIGHLMKLQPDCLQLTLVEYQERFGFIGQANVF